MDLKIRKFIWKLENFSKIEDEKLYSEIFIVNGIKLRLSICTKRHCSALYLPVSLVVEDLNTLFSTWSRVVHFGLAIIDQNDRNRSAIQVYRNHFKKFDHELIKSTLLFDEFHNPKRGYLVNDMCVIEAYVSTDASRDLISRKQIVGSNSDGHKIKNYVRVEPKPVEIVTSSHYLDFISEESTEEEMKAFFASIESEFSTVVYSREEAREAVAKLEQALSITPFDLHDSGMLASLEREFKILASFESSSTVTTTFTIEQKEEFVSMEKRVKELADRAAKAVQDKNLLVQNEINKRMITYNITRDLIRFKEVESDVKQIKRKLGNMLREQKGIFDSCKKRRMKLETLGKELTVYEANAKVAEEEEKTIEAEWKTMKDFITSIKGKI